MPDKSKESSLDELSPLKAPDPAPQGSSTHLYDSVTEKSQKDGGISEDDSALEKLIPHKEDVPHSDISLSHRILNFALAYFWLGPLVTVYWCNSWHIPENYLFPPDPVASSWISGAVGYSIYFLATFLQDNLRDFTVRQNIVVQCCVAQVYSYVMCWACINQWRCVWVLLDEYTGIYLLNAVVSCLLASMVMVILRVHRTTASTPSTIRMDFPVENHFTIPTLFEVSTGPYAKAADALFTVLVVDTVGIILWRGLWEIMDVTLTPDQKGESGAWSLVISYSVAVILFLTHDCVKILSIYLEDKHWAVSLVFEDFITVLNTIVSVNHWRGYWVLMDAYLPYKPASHWLCHIASFVLLAVGMTATSIPVLGCVFDNRLKRGEGIVFDNFYFTHLQTLWSSWKSKRQIAPSTEETDAATAFPVAKTTESETPY
ncbi:hypothetical protein BgiBS90_020692 [Biomphalaria glabrata]|nr:hypothetical protein BgiBS90_020692 [Biomphalaria glabrata]